jgi:hypothetical protein
MKNNLYAPLKGWTIHDGYPVLGKTRRISAVVVLKMKVKFSSSAVTPPGRVT